MAEKTSSLLLSGFCGHLSQKCHAGTLSMTKVAKKSFFFFFFKSHLNDIILKQNKLPWFYFKKEKKKNHGMLYIPRVLKLLTLLK